MNKSRMVFFAAVAAAAIVLLVTLLAGPSTPPASKPLDSSEITELDLDINLSPDAINGAQGGNEGGLAEDTLIHDAGPGYVWQTDEETGRRTKYQWDQVTPLPQGLHDMLRPVTRIVLSPTQVIEVSADRGRFTLEDQHFKTGTLEGHVIVRLLETDDHPQVDLDSDRDEQMRMTLDAAEFDMELGELTSASVVRVFGPRVDFTGRGLRLSYNRRHNRIDLIEIDRDVALWFKPQPQTVALATTDMQSERGTKAASPVETDKPVKEVKTETTNQQQLAEDIEPPQYYRARFERDVVVDAAERQTHMTADHLEAVFTFGGDDKSLKPKQTSKPRKKKVKQATDEKHDAPASAEASTLASDNTSLEGVRVTCSGKLIVTPEPNPEPDMLEDQSAVLLRLLGETKPVTITTEDNETVRAARVDYLTTTGRVRATSSEAGDPIYITATQLGEITGRSLMIDPATATGHVVGPGRLVTQEPDEPGNELAVDWRDRLDLTFFVEPQKSQPDRVVAIRSATFHGQTHAEHPEFNVNAETLAIELSQDGEDQHITGVEARGNARMASLATDEEQPVSIAADAIHIDIEPDDEGKDQPTHLLATGNAAAERDGMTIHTDVLDVTLAMVTEEDGETLNEPKLAVVSMTANDGVEVVATDPSIQLYGERLAVNAQNHQMELFGAANSPARAVRPDAELVGPHLVMDELSETVHVVGPGVFTFLTTPENQSDKQVKLTVVWQDSMHFDQRSGFAHFVGSVVSTADSLTDQTTLTCADLRLDFEKIETTDNNEKSNGLIGGEQRIRTVTARGKPVFKSRSFSETDPQTDLTRFYLDGPLITFDNSPGIEAVQVIGPGRMQIEDYRPASRSAATDNSNKASLVQVSGRGQTLFLWQKQLTLDAARNDMLMEQQVQMIHRPTSEDADSQGQVILMDCNQLFADLAESQGMDGWLSDSAPKPNINMIVADRDVHIKHARKTVQCDRLVYVGQKNRVELLARRNNNVRISDLDRPTPMSGRAFTWELDTDRFNVLKPGASTVPLPK